MRLDQFLSQSTGFSRKQAKAAIIRGEVSIDGIPCKKSQQHIKEGQGVFWQEQPINLPGEQYIMLNKPTGYCCSHVDDGHPSALSLLPEQTQKLVFAGRLDADTTGLVLLSTDGKWCHRITSPKQQAKCIKVYHAKLDGPVSNAAKQQLEQGVLLHGEADKTQPATLTQLGENYYQLVISEGRYHQVKRMFAAVGLYVVQLHRQAIGPITLDKTLEPGQSRPLTDKEIAHFNHAWCQLFNP